MTAQWDVLAHICLPQENISHGYSASLLTGNIQITNYTTIFDLWISWQLALDGPAGDWYDLHIEAVLLIIAIYYSNFFNHKNLLYFPENIDHRKCKEQ